MKLLFLVFGCVIGLTYPALAQSTSSDEAIRYQLEKTDDGFIKLDRVTGTITVCKLDDGKMICRLGADERAAYIAELEAMRLQLDELNNSIAALEDGNPSDQQSGADKFKKEFDTAMEVAEEAMRRLFSSVKELKDKMDKDQN